MKQKVVSISVAVALLTVSSHWAVADQVEMTNGDRYIGSVLSLNSNTLVLQNEVLGTVQLPRGKVSLITLGAVRPGGGVSLAPATRSKVPTPSAPGATAATNISPAVRQIGAHTNLIRQVQKQFLAGAGPEANQKFDELLNGLMSGKLTMDDLRAQAQSAADQLRDLKSKGGEDAGMAVDAYLAILDRFLKDTPAANPSSKTPAPAPAAKPRPGQAQE
jgi:hypothetical protein